MKQWYDVIKYRLSLYLSSGKIIVPIILFLGFTYITYQQKPSIFISDIQVSAVFVGFIMMCITFTFLDNEDVVAESILFCNMNQNKARYYGSKLATLFYVGMLLSLLGTIYPFVVNAFNSFELFHRDITAGDFIGSLLLHFMMSVLFISVGFLLQPRNLMDRKMSVLLSISVAVLTISKSGIIKRNGMWRYVMWVLPPVNNIIDCFKGVDVFTLDRLLISVLYGIGYSMIAFIIGMAIVERRKF